MIITAGTSIENADNNTPLCFFGSSLAEIRKRDTDLLRDLALSFNLTYTAFGVPISGPADSSVRTLSLTNVFGDGSEPTPISPVGVHDAPYQLLSGTIKAAHNAHRSDRSIDPVLVAPITPPFNTGEYRWPSNFKGRGN